MKLHASKEELDEAKSKLEKESQKIYSSLSPHQKLQLARHQNRPYSFDYIRLLMPDRVELHGDRHYKEDASIMCMIGKIDGIACAIIAQQKGRGTKNKLRRNFGMPHPEGYRKALRVAKLAEKFDIPLLMFIDTPGAYPGLGAEERNQSEAIAKNLYEFSALKNPTISIVIGEGGSGGALAIGVADKLAMLEYSIFSVISPEGCAAILWNDPSKAENATSALKISASDLKDFNLIDDVLKEPAVGAHRDKIGAAQTIKDYFKQSLQELRGLSTQERLQKRYEKLMSLGQFS